MSTPQPPTPPASDAAAWKERAERAEANLTAMRTALRNEEARVSHFIGEQLTAKAELAQIQAREAAMLSALKEAKASLDHFGVYGLGWANVIQAMGPNTGSTRVSRESMNPLVEALILATNTANATTGPGPVQPGSPKDKWTKALALARDLGLTEDKA